MVLEIILALIAVAFIIQAIYIIITLVLIQKAFKAVGRTANRVQNCIEPIQEEAEKILKSSCEIADNCATANRNEKRIICLEFLEMAAVGFILFQKLKKRRQL